MSVLLIILVLVVIPAGITLGSMSLQHHFHKEFAVGDPIVYCKVKASAHPGARAYAIRPCAHGESYTYLVDKYWTVADLLEDGRILAVTRTQKLHYLAPNDPNLRKASWRELWRLNNRFPHLTQSQTLSVA
jgi:hypothetical protein